MSKHSGGVCVLMLHYLSKAVIQPQAMAMGSMMEVLHDVSTA